MMLTVPLVPFQKGIEIEKKNQNCILTIFEHLLLNHIEAVMSAVHQYKTIYQTISVANEIGD